LALDAPPRFNCAIMLINEDAMLMALDESVAEVALTDDELEPESDGLAARVWSAMSARSN